MTNEMLMTKLEAARAGWEREENCVFHQGIPHIELWISVMQHKDGTVGVLRYFTGGGDIHVSVDYDGKDLAEAYKTALTIVMDLG